ncbi:hypothetical protein ACIBQ1_58560 [Nonomuraea sp. NPDC050153]|uniref:hypothetical protein n=1 Tax=Nonomuraea sp. NPDC050153 TaxID=3364359 RepID=UPI0037B6DF31
MAVLVPGWRVAERAARAKGAGPGEDRVVVLDDGDGVHCAAVIDGVTDKSGRDYGGASGGALAADRVAQTLATLPSGVSVAEAVAAVSAELMELRRKWSVAEDDLLAPAAVAAVVWPRRKLVWRVGDVHVALGHRDGGWRRHAGGKLIDTVLAGARAAYLHCLLLQGERPEDLAAGDPGRALIRPVLERQAVLANRDDAGPFGYGLLDGRPVPERFVETFALTDDVCEVVLASDGYLGPARTLSGAEAELQVSLRADRLRIMEHAATKAVAAGAESFDDRSYLRLSRRPRRFPS